jgi:hypothetical protein
MDACKMAWNRFATRSFAETGSAIKC